MEGILEHELRIGLAAAHAGARHAQADQVHQPDAKPGQARGPGAPRAGHQLRLEADGQLHGEAERGARGEDPQHAPAEGEAEAQVQELAAVLALAVFCGRGETAAAAVTARGRHGRHPAGDGARLVPPTPPAQRKLPEVVHQRPREATEQGDVRVVHAGADLRQHHPRARATQHHADAQDGATERGTGQRCSAAEPADALNDVGSVEEK
mmetsp:Transcript_40591/g.113668  ORF Transcript_40591/g.113668 Transcript_40591/m.113668 type:complete len:209 (+) Transcript_40591:1172-1798(+)